MDRRTLQNAIASGEIEGWARPGPQRLRWHVYEDQLPTALRADVADDRTGEIAELRREIAELRAQVQTLDKGPAGLDPSRMIEAIRGELRSELTGMTESVVADLRADIVTLRETNLLLLEAQEELGGVATTLDSVAQKYRRALAQFMTPGHAGELTDR